MNEGGGGETKSQLYNQRGTGDSSLSSLRGTLAPAKQTRHNSIAKGFSSEGGGKLEAGTTHVSDQHTHKQHTHTLFSMRERDSRKVRVSSFERGVPGAEPPSRLTRLLLLSWNGAGTVGPWQKKKSKHMKVLLVPRPACTGPLF